MSIAQWLIGKLGLTSKSYPKDYWPSVVLLLKDPVFPMPEEVLQTAQASWGAHAPVESLGALKNSASYILRCGGLLFSVNCGTGRYGVEGQESTEALQRPWDQHKAWMSIDLPNARNEELRKAGDLGGSYKLLLIFAFKSWSQNCVGIYFPAESITIPNFGELAESIEWARRNGQDLTFLDSK
jgi:hypothetical protein